MKYRNQTVQVVWLVAKVNILPQCNPQTTDRTLDDSAKSQTTFDANVVFVSKVCFISGHGNYSMVKVWLGSGTKTLGEGYGKIKVIQKEKH